MRRSSAPNDTPSRALHREAPQEFSEEGQDGFEKARQHFLAGRRPAKQENLTADPYWNADPRWKTSREYQQFYSATNLPWSSESAGEHGVMQGGQSQPDPTSSASYDYYGGYYDQYQYQQYHQQSMSTGTMRTCDGAPGYGNPSSGAVDHQRRQTRSGYDASTTAGPPAPPNKPPAFPKRDLNNSAEPTDLEGDNFSSIFTKSLTSLYSQDAENAYAEEGDPDVMICEPTPNAENSSYQRLGGGSNLYNMNANPGRGNSGFGYYDGSRTEGQSCDPGASPNDQKSFRYDRPSFDDMHLYASSQSSALSKSQLAKKRKLSMPNMSSDGFPSGDSRNKKLPRMLTFKSDSKWTPNSCSFAFDDIAIKEEPIDDYPVDGESMANAGRKPETTSTSVGKHQGDPEHPKPQPRKRSPGATCFDKFDKNSSKTSKKISPLSVYAKVQDSIVLSLKCRRYKKRTKSFTGDGYHVNRDEMDSWKRNGGYHHQGGPEQAVRHVIGELLERVTQCGDRHVSDLPDFAQIGPHRVRELLYQFCQRYSLDYKDFEDIDSVMKPCLVTGDQPETVSERATIRKRTSALPVQPKPEPVTTAVAKAQKPVSKKVSEAPAERRVLRKLPGREERGKQTRRRRGGKTPSVTRRRYSTRSVKDTDNDDAGNSDADIIIDSSSEEESCKEEIVKDSKKAKAITSKDGDDSHVADAVQKPAKNQADGERNISKIKNTGKHKEEGQEKSGVKGAQKRKWSRLSSKYPSDSSQSGSSVDEAKKESSSTHGASEKLHVAGSSEKSQTSSEKSKTSGTSEKSHTSGTSVKSKVSETSEKPKVSEKIQTLGTSGKSQTLGSSEKSQTFNASEKSQILNTGKSLTINTEKSQIINLDKTPIVKLYKKLPIHVTEFSKQLQTAETCESKNEKPSEQSYTMQPSEKFHTGGVSQKTHTVLVSEKLHTGPHAEKLQMMESVEKSQPKGTSDRTHTTEVSKEPLTLSGPMQKSNLISSSHVLDNAFSAAKDSSTQILNASHTVDAPPKCTIQRPIPIYCKRPPIDPLDDAPPFLRKIEGLDSKPPPSKFDPKKLGNWRVSLEQISIEDFQREQAHSSGSSIGNPENLRYTPNFTAPQLDPKYQEPEKLEVANTEALQVNTEMKQLDKCSKESNAKQRDSKVIQNSAQKTEAQNDPKNERHFDGPPIIHPHEQFQTDYFAPKHSNSDSQGSSSKSISSFGIFESGAFGAVSLIKKTFEGFNDSRSPVQSADGKVCESDKAVNVENATNEQPLYLGKPPELVLMKDIKKEFMDASKNGETSRSSSVDPKDSELSPVSYFLGKLERGKTTSRPKESNRQRKSESAFSESDDSDGGLVIDLDRGQTTEDKTSACPAKDTAATSESTSTPASAPVTVKNETMEEESPLWEDDDDCVILMDPSDDAKLREKCEKTLKDDRDESILRTLLLETGEVLNGSSSSQDNVIPSSQQADHSNSLPGTDSKATIGQEVMKLLMYQSYHDGSSSSSSPGFGEDKKHIIEKLSPGSSPHMEVVVGEQEDRTVDWSRDPRQLKEKIKKLKNEIIYLQCMAEQKDKERTAIVCFKRYKEEILRRLVKEYAFNVQDHVRDWIRSKHENSDSRISTFRPSPSLRTPPTEMQASIASIPQPRPAHSRPPSLYHSLHKGDQAGTSRKSPSKQHYGGEKLPTVETLIAKATENYGVDMRTMRNHSTVSNTSTSTTQTILKKVLSSKESFSPIPHLTPALTEPTRPKTSTNNSQPPLQLVQKNAALPKEYGPLDMMTKTPTRSTADPKPPFDARTLPKLYDITKFNAAYPTLFDARSKSKHYDAPKLVASSEYPMVYDSRTASKPYDIPKSSKCDYPMAYDNRSASSKHYVSKSSASVSEYQHSGYDNSNRTVSKSYDAPKTAVSEYTSAFDKRTVASKACDYNAGYDAKGVLQQSNSLKPGDYDAKNRMKHATSASSYWSIQSGGKVNHADVSRPVDSVKVENVGPLRNQSESSSKRSPTSHGLSQVSLPQKVPQGLPIKSEPHHERSLKSSVERIYNRKSEEERRALSYPSMVAPSSKSSAVPYGGHLLGIGQPPSGQIPGSKTPCPNSTPRCMGCGLSDAKFLCSGCRKHWYCSSQCQTLRWPEHSRICSGSIYAPPL